MRRAPNFSGGSPSHEGAVRILITRAEPDASAFAGQCRAHGFDPVLAPVMQIDLHKTPVNLTGVGALAFTSANGVRAFAANEARRDLPVFAVGAVTAAAAKAAGFCDVRAAGGDVDSLADHIASESATLEGCLLHLAGEDRAGDLVASLDARGVPAKRQTLYTAHATRALPPAVVDFLKSDPPEWAAFFSPRTARLFIELAHQAGLADALAQINAACLSDAVATAAGDLWRAKRIAGARNAASLIAAILDHGAARG